MGPHIVSRGVGGFVQTQGCEGLTLHNGGNPDGTEPDDAAVRRERQFYRWENSARADLQMRTGETRILYSLTPTNAGDGGFCAIPGSHKGNLPCPLALRRLESSASIAAVVQPVLMPGDAVVFSENCTHGTMPWTSPQPRRALSIAYHPAYLSGGINQQHASHEVVDEGWANGGAQEALYRAITQTGQWWSSVAPVSQTFLAVSYARSSL
jgi:ectoine hydroxylase-related dioxygenase (phytanoyl-CoA dioxygenase family)